jgi:hypothetical protein
MAALVHPRAVDKHAADNVNQGVNFSEESRYDCNLRRIALDAAPGAGPVDDSLAVVSRAAAKNDRPGQHDTGRPIAHRL